MIGPPAREAVPVLIEMLQGEQVTLACQALGAIGPDARPALPVLLKMLQRHRGQSPAAAGAVAQISPEGGEVLREILRLADIPTRTAALEGLRKCGPQAAGALAEILPLLQDKVPAIRALTCRVVGTIGAEAKGVVPVLTLLIKDPDRGVREEAVRALGAVGAAGVPALVKALEGGDLTLKKLAAQALAAVGTEARVAVPALGKALADPSAAVRVEVIRALAAVGPEATKVMLPELSRLLRGKEADTRRAAAAALVGLGADAVPALQVALRDDNYPVRQLAAETLGTLGPAARESVADLVRTLKDENALVRARAAAALGAIGTDAALAVPALEEAARADRSTDVRQAARAALAKVR